MTTLATGDFVRVCDNPKLVVVIGRVYCITIADEDRAAGDDRHAADAQEAHEASPPDREAVLEAVLASNASFRVERTQCDAKSGRTWVRVSVAHPSDAINKRCLVWLPADLCAPAPDKAQRELELQQQLAREQLADSRTPSICFTLIMCFLPPFLLFGWALASAVLDAPPFSVFELLSFSLVTGTLANIPVSLVMFCFMFGPCTKKAMHHCERDARLRPVRTCLLVGVPGVLAFLGGAVPTGFIIWRYWCCR